MRLIRLFFILIFINSCSIKNIGLYISDVTGSIEYKQSDFNKTLPKGFVLAILRNKSLVSIGESVLESRKIVILMPDENGNYDLSVGLAFSRVDLYVIFEGYTVDHQAVSQTIGQRRAEVNSLLSKNKAWKDYYYFALKPFLSSVMDDVSYGATVVDIAYISNFLKDMESAF